MSKYQVGDYFEIYSFDENDSSLVSSIREVMDTIEGVLYGFYGLNNEIMWMTEEYLDGRKKL